MANKKKAKLFLNVVVDYVRHEMIHYLQGERLGVLRLLFKPSWFVEGMAYSLSQDPRALLAEPFEDYRKEFLSWYASIDKQRIWVGRIKGIKGTLPLFA